MSLRTRLASRSLLWKFSVLSLLAVLVLGFALARFFAAGIERRALANAEQTASLVASGVARQLSESELRRGFRPRRLDELDAALPKTGVRQVKVFGPTGELLYTDDRAALGERYASAGLREALAGRVASHAEHGGDHAGSADAVLEVYVPLRKRGRVVGAFELYLPHGHVLAGIREDTLAVYGVTGGGLVLLYLLLWRILARASRTLRAQADLNRRMAREDALTGLANRRHLEDATRTALESPSVRRAALMLVDLDHFKEVNDTLGHQHGDRLLEQVAQRLRATLRDTDCLARLGGDEFAVLTASIRDRGSAAEVASRISAALERPFEVAGLAVPLEGSVGVALYPEHGDDVETLMRHADVAMYRAKALRERVITYSSEFDDNTADRLALAGELRHAVARGELVVCYQPLVSADGRRVQGAEALVRWVHPRRGLLGPGEFIALAERTGDIAAITDHVLDEALHRLRDWLDRGFELGMSVNLAAANATDARLPDRVGHLLARHGVAPHRLTLEISEDTAMSDSKRVTAVLARLDAMGVRLALDDFGAGSSSLAYLRSLRLDELKIDRSFVMAMADSEDDAVIVRSTVELAHNLGLDCVAEGVETAGTADTLAALGCETLQGYHFARPLPAADFDAWLRASAAAAPRESRGAPRRRVASPPSR